MTWVSQINYAAHRRVSAPMVTKWVQSGRLKGATRPKGKKIEINQEKADKILDAHLEPAWGGDRTKKDKPEKTAKPTKADKERLVKDMQIDELGLNEARQLEAQYSAALKRLKYEQESKLLILAAEVEQAAFGKARVLRDALLNIPDRIGPILAAECDPIAVTSILDAEIRQVLEQLTDG